MLLKWNEYFSRRVLAITEGIENPGGMRWELFGVLILSWIMIYFIIWKGINQSGYVSQIISFDFELLFNILHIFWWAVLYV
jgi:solute carrier family 6 GABA transporter-like protein 1